MANEQNLKPFRSVTEAREKGRKGGKASGKTRGALKTFKQAMIDQLTEEDQKAILAALLRNAKRGNLPSTEFLLKLIGEDPDKGSAEETAAESGVVIIPSIKEEGDS